MGSHGHQLSDVYLVALPIFPSEMTHVPTAWWRHLLSNFAPAKKGDGEHGERQGKRTKSGRLLHIPLGQTHIRCGKPI